MDQSSNTGKNRPDKKPGTFEKGKGKDPRINRKGRPKHFDAFRALAVSISQEVAKNAEGTPFINKQSGKPASIAETILRTWAQSPDPRKQFAFIEYAFGKVPAKTELTGKDGADLPATKMSAFNGYSLEEIAATIKQMEDAV